MDFMSNLSKVVKETSEVVIKETGELVDTAKIKYEIFSLKNQMEKIYTDIGREIYKGYLEDIYVADTVEEKCNELDALKEKKEHLEYKLKNK